MEFKEVLYRAKEMDDTATLQIMEMFRPLLLKYAKVNNPLKRWLNAIYTHALPLKGKSTRLNQFLFYAGGTISQAEVLIQ